MRGLRDQARISDLVHRVPEQPRNHQPTSCRACAAREVLRVLNSTDYAPKHYVDLGFVAQWRAGEPKVREPDKVERWDWYALDEIPSPLFAMLPSAIAMWIDARPLQLCQDLP